MAAEYAYELNYSYGNAAPQRLPQEYPQHLPQQKPNLRRVPRKRQTLQQRKVQEHQANLKAAKLFGFMALAIVLLGIFCNSFVVRSTSRQALRAATQKLNEQNEISVVLNKELDNLVTAENIDKIAASLGLVKVQSGSETYLNLSGENRVRTLQGK
jgi:cell division protein FtsL